MFMSVSAVGGRVSGRGAGPAYEGTTALRRP